VTIIHRGGWAMHGEGAASVKDQPQGQGFARAADSSRSGVCKTTRYFLLCGTVGSAASGLQASTSPAPQHNRSCSSGCERHAAYMEGEGYSAAATSNPSHSSFQRVLFSKAPSETEICPETELSDPRERQKCAVKPAC